MKTKFTLENPMPPLWMMYPHIGLGSLGWRMGNGEVYAEKHYIWYRSLSESEQKKYQEMFPPPKPWRGYYKSNYGFEDLLSAYIEFNILGLVEYSSEKLIEKYDSGESIDYLFFWKPNTDAIDKSSLLKRIVNFFGCTINDTNLYKQDMCVVDKSCLGQWQPSIFYSETDTYCCAEQYMMAEKARLFDYEIRKLIMKSTNPKEIKVLGKKIRNFKQDVWDSEKYSIVVHANYYKFTQNDEMRNFLFSTGDKVLVEASPFDTVWGIGLSENDEKAQNPNLWQGQNLLGMALMDVRDDLRKAYQNYDIIDWSFKDNCHNWLENDWLEHIH